MSDPSKVSHAVHLASRLKRMKEQGLVCDFAVKVGNKSYPVHRAVLFAMSGYFEGLFSSNMKEVEQGFIEVRDVEVTAVEKSLEFMYTGSTKVTIESVQSVLHTAELFQLSGLKNICFQFLVDNTSTNNVLSVINIATVYNRPDVKETAEKFVISNIKAVVSTEMFPSISRSDLLQYISNADHQTKWKGVVIWAAENEDFLQLLKAIDLENFPFQLLLDAVLDDPLVNKFVAARNMIIQRLFSQPFELERSINARNCIALKLLAQKQKVDGELQNMINCAMEENFGEIVPQAMFCDLTGNDIINIFQSRNARYSSETLKFEAAKKWVKHDIKERRKLFQQLFSLIKFEHLPIEFLKKDIRHEPLVKESRKCSELLMDALLARASGNEIAPRSLSVPSSEEDRKVVLERIIGQEGGGPGCLCEPWGITSTPDGNIIVADAGNHRIQIFGPTGRSIRIFGCKGSGPGEFLCPCDVSAAPSGLLAVADHLNHRIQIFDRNGNFIREFGEQGRLNHPWSVSIDRKGLVYVVSCNTEVCAYSLNGDLMSVFGTDQFPCNGGEVYVTTKKDDKVVVVYSYSGMVWIFDKSLKLVYEYKFGEYGFERGVACDKRGFLFMGNSENYIQVLELAQNRKWTFGRSGSNPGQVIAPRGVAVLPSGKLAVSDSGNHRIQIFSVI